MITAEKEGIIHSAMETAGGNPRMAADYLGITRVELNNIIQNNKNLALRWRKARKSTPAPTEAVQIHRPETNLPQQTIEEIQATVLQTEAEIAAALAKEDELVKAGLDGTGMSRRVRDFAMSVQRVAGRHFTKLNEMLAGGMAKTSLEMHMEVEDLTKKLNDPNNPPTIEQEMLWREDRRGLLDQICKMTAQNQQFALIQAKAQALRKQAAGEAGRRPGKPGFTPLVTVQGQNVTINEK